MVVHNDERMGARGNYREESFSGLSHALVHSAFGDINHRDPAVVCCPVGRFVILITTRTAVADIADHEGTSALRCDLEQLSSATGAQLLRALSVKGHEAELRSASDEFRGHCLALTLLGSYLTDAYDGDIRCGEEVSTRLPHDVRWGVHARKLSESYQVW